MLDEKEINSSIIPIGKEVAIFRTLLNCTQQEFANLLLLSRVTISKLEQCQDISILSPDIAFRLFYVTQKIVDNEFKEDYVKAQAKVLQHRVDIALQKHITTQ